MSLLPDVLVVMALPAESAGVFEAAGVPVLYCGVGKVNAAHVLTLELARYIHGGQKLPLVVNFGSAGSRRYAAGTICACRQFVQRDMDASGLGFALGVTPFEDTPACLSFDPLLSSLQEAVCGSGDSFVMNETRVACTVFDMEAYALAKICWLHGTQFVCVKYVTDGADHAAADEWQCNVDRAAHEFLRLYRTVVNTRTGSAISGAAAR